MSQTKLEILISARDAATQVMGRVKGAFALRTAEINGMSNSLVKNGEKVEKFLHGVSLLKMATETESFKSALAGISPSLQKTTSDLLNMGIAVGGTLSLLKDLATLRQLSFAGPAALGLAGVAGVAAAAQASDDALEEQKRLAAAQNARFDALMKMSTGFKSRQEMNLTDRMLRDGSQDFINQGRDDLAAQIRNQIVTIGRIGEQIIAKNKQWAEVMAERAKLAKFEFDRAAVRSRMQSDLENSPQGQMAARQRLIFQRNATESQLAGIDTNKDPAYWLKVRADLDGINDALEKNRAILPSTIFGDLKTNFDALKEKFRGLNVKFTPGGGALPQIQTNRLLQMGGQIGGGAVNPFAGAGRAPKVEIDFKKLQGAINEGFVLGVKAAAKLGFFGGSTAGA